MTLKILEAQRTRSPYTPIANGRTAMLLGGLENAKFECGCGHVFTAFTSQSRLNGGFFFQSSSGVTVECPSCKTMGNLATEDYDDVL
ncbi:hypothetical protein AKG95_29230 (plasmid) [Janthinobacterium lividum]|uniref:Uncharacterized protein n=1 Tax=Janthinobacterium lividum TaxID=29581 RepID=A0A1S1TZY9_9BURK|nr:hypothetical protein AKG95_29230 [Janthinobacterium lividum]